MRSTDFCLSSEGADVILATSSDENFPPENITDGRSDTFWTTTGMFPQEFIICFHRCVSISKLTVQCYLGVISMNNKVKWSEQPVWAGVNGRAQSLSGTPRGPSRFAKIHLKPGKLIVRFTQDYFFILSLVRMLRIEKSMSKDPVDFEHCIEKELQYKEGELQTEEFSLPELQATHLRFIILSGYDAFVSIHRLIADGIAQEI